MNPEGQGCSGNGRSLPLDSLAKLIRTAVEECRQLDRGVYRPNGNQWHAGDTLHKCEVCVGGGLLARRFDLDPEWHYGPTDLWVECGEEAHSALRALDCARLGEWGTAYEFLGHTGRARWAIAHAGAGVELAPEPALKGFSGWNEFEAHLNSLEACAEALGRFERDVSAGCVEPRPVGSPPR